MQICSTYSIIHSLPSYISFKTTALIYISSTKKQPNALKNWAKQQVYSNDSQCFILTKYYEGKSVEPATKIRHQVKENCKLQREIETD